MDEIILIFTLTLGSTDSDSTRVVPLCGPSSTVTTPLEDEDDEEDDDSTEAIEAGPQLLVAGFQLGQDVADGT